MEKIVRVRVPRSHHSREAVKRRVQRIDDLPAVDVATRGLANHEIAPGCLLPDPLSLCSFTQVLFEPHRV